MFSVSFSQLLFFYFNLQLVQIYLLALKRRHLFTFFYQTRSGEPKSEALYLCNPPSPTRSIGHRTIRQKTRKTAENQIEFQFQKQEIVTNFFKTVKKKKNTKSIIKNKGKEKEGDDLTVLEAQILNTRHEIKTKRKRFEIRFSAISRS